ncbi:MAG: mammalian cell entry protein [Rhodocyclaceae bacterium]|nr:mammalian cell entry protein [Rhodocyclaceae bacterium]
MTLPEPDIPVPPPIPNAGAKTVALIVMTVLLLGGFALYVMTARGVFEENRRLVLVAENSEGVVIGMDLTFSGFAIGRVGRIELGADGKAHIHIDVPTRDAHWLRTSSVFTLERGVVGGARLRAYTGLLDDPPLADGARRDVLIGDATAGIPLLVSTLRELADNLARITAPDAPLNASIGNLQTLTGAMTGRHGALAGILGETGARRILESLERTNRLLAQTDARLFGKDGLVDGARRTNDELHAAIVDVRTLLAAARGSLQKADATLDEARAIAVNARVATDDLDALRNEVEASLRKISGLVEEVNRKWPFARDRELKLP